MSAGPPVFIRAVTEPGGDGLRIAIKDCIHVAGMPTTVGSRAIERDVHPAAADAECVRRLRAAGHRIVGKVNLHELCFGSTGVNPWFGTPPNPFDGTLIPGGSSSGSAVAVATGDADAALGTDTVGSVRTPAACCAVVGVRPTYGLIPADGVVALAPSLDTVGLLARTVADATRVLACLAPLPATSESRRVGRLRDLPCAPEIDRAVDRALAAAALDPVDLHWADIDELVTVTVTVLLGEAWVEHGHLLRTRPDDLGDEVVGRLTQAAAVGPARLERARAALPALRRRVVALFDAVDVIALAAYPTTPPAIADRCPAPVTLALLAAAAGLPAVAVPVPSDGPIPASLQLVGPPGGDAGVLAVAADVEAAVGPSVWARPGDFR